MCQVLGLLLLCAGMAGPQWGLDWGQTAAPGRDVMVVLDQSRSMFAESPSRLLRGRDMILDLAGALRQRGGHRVGLVTFAGRPRLACPLTHDLDHFREVVAGLDVALPDPDLEQEGQASGTRIGLALALATRSLDSEVPGASDIILISDGDDPARDGEWRLGASTARTAGIPVHVIGVGDPDQLVSIPLGPDRTPLLVGETIVQTRLQEGPLRDVANLSGGDLTVAGLRPLALGEFYLGSMTSDARREDSPDALPVYRPRYRWFVGAALALLALSLALPDRFSWRSRR
jgi:Ca-activated chloride channel family protein